MISLSTLGFLWLCWTFSAFSPALNIQLPLARPDSGSQGPYTQRPLKHTHAPFFALPDLVNPSAAHVIFNVSLSLNFLLGSLPGSAPVPFAPFLVPQTVLCTIGFRVLPS